MKNLIIITSVINISNNPLDYTKVRSVYNKEERYRQTIRTIETCSKIFNKEILFIETSNLCENMESYIRSKVDYYINLNNDLEIKKVIDGKYKGKSESIQIFNGLKLVDLNNYDNLIKISGRYWFGSKFKYDNYNNEFNIFKEGPKRLGTAMYKIHRNSFKDYIKCIDFCMRNNGQLEVEFFNFFKDNHITYDKIGLEGNVSVDGNLINW